LFECLQPQPFKPFQFFLGRFQEGSRKVPGRFQEGSRKVPGRFQEGSRKVPRQFIGGYMVRNLPGTFLKKVEMV
jgi:hypothetical protein